MFKKFKKSFLQISQKVKLNSLSMRKNIQNDDSFKPFISQKIKNLTKYITCLLKIRFVQFEYKQIINPCRPK